MAQDERLSASPKGRSKGGPIVVLLLLAVAAAAFWFLGEREAPSLELGRDITAIGARVDLPVKAADAKSGLSLVSVRLKQGEKTKELFVRRFPRASWFTRQAGPAEFAETVAVGAGDAGFDDGPAELIVTARDQSVMGFFRGNRTEIRRPVTVDTRPPQVRLKGAHWAIQPGGSAAVGYTVSEEPARHGVRIGGTFFPGAPGKAQGQYVCLFALPWNAPAAGASTLEVWDAAGNETKIDFNVGFKPWRPKSDTIKLSDAFFERKMPEFRQHYPEMRGSLLDQYLFVNREVRRRNAEQVRTICSKSDPERLWNGRFLRMPGAGRAGFADQRSYMYQGKKVDEQNHLGVDIASVVQDEVRAANRGKVAFAGFIGIYGNVVILDHGQGLFSLYAHLSSIDPAVKQGALVEADKPIGRTGVSGMAGGDHLHFSMLVNGIFVTPLEWWEQRWIDTNIKPHME